MSLKEYLVEALTIPNKYFHGSKVDFKKFDPKYIIIPSSNALHGPGFYLSTDKDDADKYAGKSGFLHNVELTKTSNIKTKYSKIKSGFIERMVDAMPDAEMVLSDWDEDSIKAKRRLVKSLYSTNSDIIELLQSIWFECYKNYEQDMIKEFVKEGIDGILVEMKEGVKHLICYNPDILKIVSSEKVESED